MIDQTLPDLMGLCCATTPNAAVSLFLSALPGWGFHGAAAGGWAAVPGAQVHRFYFHTWPEGWGRIYAEANLFPRDPVLALARRRSRPFLLTEEADAMRKDPTAAEVIDMTHAFGWAEVMPVPIHEPAGYQGLVALAAFRPVALDAPARALIAACAREVHKAQRLLEAGKLSQEQFEQLVMRISDSTDNTVAGVHESTREIFAEFRALFTMPLSKNDGAA